MRCPLPANILTTECDLQVSSPCPSAANIYAEMMDIVAEQLINSPTTTAKASSLPCRRQDKLHLGPRRPGVVCIIILLENITAPPHSSRGSRVQQQLDNGVTCGRTNTAAEDQQSSTNLSITAAARQRHLQRIMSPAPLNTSTTRTSQQPPSTPDYHHQTENL